MNNTIALWIIGIEAAVSFIIQAVLWWRNRRRDKRWIQEEEERFMSHFDEENQ